MHCVILTMIKTHSWLILDLEYILKAGLHNNKSQWTVIVDVSVFHKQMKKDSNKIFIHILGRNSFDAIENNNNNKNHT